jgi:hypothetical protein
MFYGVCEGLVIEPLFSINLKIYSSLTFKRCSSASTKKRSAPAGRCLDNDNHKIKGIKVIYINYLDAQLTEIGREEKSALVQILQEKLSVCPYLVQSNIFGFLGLAPFAATVHPTPLHCSDGIQMVQVTLYILVHLY